MQRAKNCSPAAILLVIGLFFTGASTVAAAETFTPVYHPTLEVSRTRAPIEIDGNLDDPGWRGAAKADNFAEHNPGDQTKPPVNTEAYITYDDAKLYVSFICYDDPATIRASMTERDRIGSDDNICFLLDTYGDAVWAYEFNVNPYGIQGDLLWSADQGEDSRFDLIWESAGQITDSGWQIELALPFSSLRFPNTEEQVWKMDFWRNHPREVRRQYSWAAYDRDDPCWPCKWGTVTGIRNVAPGRGIELMPSLVAFQSGSLDGDGTSGSPFDFVNDDGDGEMSLNAKYSITSDVTTEATYNPDFSQIEGDQSQIDVNTNFALFYNERRPFFREGDDLFRTYFDAVYTRSINDPDFAGKLIARLNRTSVAYLVARDNASPMILPFEENSEILLAGKSVSNIVRARRTFGSNSRVGLLVNDRRMDGGGSGTLFSTDGQLRLAKNYALGWQVIGTHTEEPNDTAMTSGFNDVKFDSDSLTAGFDGESFSGYAYYLQLVRDSRDSYSRLDYTERSPTFRSENGFQPSNNQRRVRFTTQYVHRPENSFMINLIPSVELGKEWNFDGVTKEEYVSISLENKFNAAQTSLHSQYIIGNENYGGVQFDGVWSVHTCLHSIPSKYLALGGHINYARKIARNQLVFGHETSTGFWFDIRPVDRLLMENSYSYSTSKDVDTDERLWEGFLFWSRISLQMSRRLSLRVVSQYDDFYESWDVDPMLTYRLNAFSVFYVGTTYRYDTYDGLGPHGLDNSTRLSSRQFFMKLQYLFQV